MFSFLALLSSFEFLLTLVGVVEGEGAALVWNKNYKKKPAYFGFLGGIRTGGKSWAA
jgi:hypothetical protein